MGKKGPIRYLFVVKYKKQEQADISEAEMLIYEALRPHALCYFAAPRPTMCNALPNSPLNV